VDTIKQVLCTYTNPAVEPPPAPTHASSTFVHWNSEPAGTGRVWSPDAPFLDEDATYYAIWDNFSTPVNYRGRRLPTEPEWEFAVRGGNRARSSRVTTASLGLAPTSLGFV
jgi:formylglycine-generating enzyme required for sulfatase activity